MADFLEQRRKVGVSTDSRPLVHAQEIADHQFGSQGTELKLSIVEAYLRAYAKALHGKFPELWYIDAFAGTGQRTEQISETRMMGNIITPAKTVRHRGSAKIAIDVEPHFDRLIFVEQKPRAVKALQELRAQHGDRQIEIIGGDANREIPWLIQFVNWRRIRAVMFLDPYGMNVDWDTLQAIANTRAIDVWFLFSLSGLYRQAARNAGAIDGHKRAAISRVLGTDDWEKELYAPIRHTLFPDEDSRMIRTAGVNKLQDYVRSRLKTIFPAVLPPLPLPIDKRPQKFSLFFAISNGDGPAIGLATRIADHILKAGMSSQRRSR